MSIILVIALAIGMIVSILALGVGIAVWKTWWLHPLWALLVIPLGVPAISFWHFLALNLFVHAVLGPPPTSDCKKETEGAAGRTIGSIAVVMLWPMIAYYFAIWYMS